MPVVASGSLSARYTIERELGSGATAKVFLARDTKHDRLVALKILRPELAHALGAERFLREIRVAAGLQHPNILPLYDSGETESSLYFVMPYMAGETLRERISREGRMSLAHAVAIVREMADALTFAHDRGVVHRDVKPDNIILGEGHALIGDFGIAQALTVATGDRPTGGFVVGTLPYMSPEQAAGDSRIDGRSDQYSLACVFFEMMTGHSLHDGTTPVQLLAQRLRRPPKRIRSVRKDVPRAVDVALARALEPDAALRFGTARDFADELTRVATTMTGPARRQRVMSWLAGAASVTVAALALTWLLEPRSPPLDSTLYAVLPFAHDSAVASRLGGDNCQLLLSTAFSHWRGMRLVDQMRANSAYAQVVGGHVPTLERVLDAARALGAGTAAWGSVHSVRDSIYVRATLYDVSSGESIREFQVALSQALDGLSGKFRQLADSLLLHVAGAPTTADAMGTTSLDAWRAYGEGHRALARWDLPGAHAAFVRATEFDPDYAHAWLWRVQSMNWSRTAGPALWRDAAVRLVSLRDRLPPEEQEFSMALLELAEEQFPRACQRYRALLAADSLNFRAWFGLGECQSLDRAIVGDRASPTGWRFRSSQHGAIEAYRRALSLTPATFMAFRGRAFDRLQARLFTNPAFFRTGFVIAGRDTTLMGAFPSMIGDTIAFIPYPMSKIMEFTEARPATLDAAVARNRSVLLQVTETWSRAFPRSADALEAHGRALESFGALTAPATANAHVRYRTALALSADPEQQLRLAGATVRVFLKTGNFAEAGRLADSLAAIRASASERLASARAPLAALGGRIRLASDLAAEGASAFTIYLPSGRVLTPPFAVGAAAWRAGVYAAFESDADTLRLLMRRVQVEINRWIPPADRRDAAAAILEPIAAVAFEVLGRSEYHERPVLWLTGVQRSLILGDTAGTLASLDSLASEDHASAESVYHGARIALRLRDTARAKAVLERFVSDLPSSGDHVLDEAMKVAPLTRALALHAELLSGTEPVRARQLAEAVIGLWRRPDSELQQIVRRMQEIKNSR